MFGRCEHERRALGESGAGLRARAVQRFREVFHALDATIRRGLQFRIGEETPDVDCPGVLARGQTRQAAPNVRGRCARSPTPAPPGRIPIAIIRDDRAEPFVALSLDDFLEFVAELVGAEDK